VNVPAQPDRANPKLEYRNPKQIPNPKQNKITEYRLAYCTHPPCPAGQTIHPIDFLRLAAGRSNAVYADAGFMTRGEGKKSN
jgi:hypothetical protein